MRESQMKKLVALAVAGAFMAPVYAADITLSGDIEFRYISGNTGESTDMDDADITVTATEELANGWKVTAKIAAEDVVEDGSSNAGDGDVELTVAGSFGTLKLGEVDQAVNAVDELADFAPTSGDVAAPSLSSSEDATNVISYTAPTLVPGLTLMGSLGWNATAGQESSSIALKYSAAGFTVSYGTLDSAAATVVTKYTGVAYSNSGLTVAYDKSTDDDAVGTDTETMGLKYAMGDITLAYEANETTTSTPATTSLDVLAAYYSIGGGLSVYLESADSSTADADTTTFGVLYKF